MKETVLGGLGTGIFQRKRYELVPWFGSQRFFD